MRAVVEGWMKPLVYALLATKRKGITALSPPQYSAEQLPIGLNNSYQHQCAQSQFCFFYESKSLTRHTIDRQYSQL